jgi:SPP1 family predicted phage head-tail adaptor
MTIGAGDLRHEIKLEKQVSVPDGIGGQIVSWQEVTTTPALIRVLRVGEEIMAGRLQGMQTLVVTVRNQAGLGDADTSWRLTSTRSGRVYGIKGFTPDKTGAFIDILAQTGVI